MKLPIIKILEDGVRAPSGENCQPWKFRVVGEKLSVFNVPEADMSLYNTKQRGSYMAHGALLENISISAKYYGYESEIFFFPDPKNENHVADVIFTETEAVTLPLYDAIRARCTNRKDFKKEKLSKEDLSALSGAVESLSYNTFVVVDDEHSMKTLGQALSVHEKVLFENKKMHGFFFSHILWKKEDEKKAGGFFIDTLEFLPHQLPLVKLLKNWNLVAILNTILKISSKISKENGDKYAYGGTMGAILMKGATSLDYVHLGMSMQRVWLTATKLGIAMHPCNGTLYLMSHMEDSGSSDFSRKHEALVRSASADIALVFGLSSSGAISFIFRMGKADAPTAVAGRLHPVIEYVTL